MARLSDRSPAHRLSSKFFIDPFPEKKEGKKEKTSTRQWLYASGDLEAFQIQRMRVEAHWECVNILHPGLYKNFSHHLFLRKRITLTKGQKVAKFQIGYSGTVHFACNDRAVYHQQCATALGQKATLDLMPYLKTGKNRLIVTVSCLGHPPAFLMTGALGTHTGGWDVSSDGFHYHDPESFPDAPKAAFPHSARLDIHKISPRQVANGIYDFGLEIFGSPAVQLTADRGKITLFVGESPQEAANRNPAKFEQPIVNLSLDENHRAKGNKVAFRYLEIEKPGNVSVAELWCEAEYRPVRHRGAFACSDDVLTKIWQHSAYTLHLCMREVFVDGLKRDRLPWVGDLYVAIAGNAFSFGDREIVKRSLSALAPEDPGKCHINGILDYTLYWVLCLQLYHTYFDDAEFVRSSWSHLEKIFLTLEASEDHAHFLIGKKEDWIFIDWAEIDKKGVSASLQMLYVMTLEAGVSLAKVCGKRQHELRLGKKALHLRAQCREAFWSKKSGAFASVLKNDRLNNQITRHANFLAVLSGTASPDQRKALHRNVILNPRVPDVGTPYMRFFEFLAYRKFSAMDLALDGISSYWGGMLEAGATTFWEAFDKKKSLTENLNFYGRPFGNSLCHAWASGPLSLLSGELWGLEIVKPGWQKIRVRPPRHRLAWAKATWPTPHGDIHASWENGRLDLSVPKGVEIIS